ncbi:hypothetical protein [Luteibacter sp. SG786]|uniref:hypothetical protein n=1 Tax=Luteibacter sp. SG786 TaxID=2587130 RepID=UPI001423505B|nr:hypothetical protein [Luteibacter sp. SG786]NII54357.1 hypothetical protein [Luteibacter sp. SG786]
MKHVVAPDVKAGDWISFRSNGRIVIGEVRYIVCPNFYAEAVTDAGSVVLSSILEVRAKGE